MAVVDIFLGMVKAVVFIYDIVTFPVYQARQHNHFSGNCSQGNLTLNLSDYAAAVGDQVQGQAAVGKGDNLSLFLLRRLKQKPKTSIHRSAAFSNPPTA